MIKTKEIFSTITYSGDGDWDIEIPLEKAINMFLEENENIHVIDIKYMVCSVGNSSLQSSALVIYEEEPIKFGFKEQIEARIGYKEWCEAHKDEETTTPC